MSDQPNTPDDEPEVAQPAATPDAPAADVERTETPREAIIEATDAVDDVPEPTDAPEAAAPAAKPKPPARKRDAKPSTPARKPNGKIARDKHGLPITTGPVVQAHAKYVRTSARKARLVCDHIRGKSVEDAVAILAHTPRAVAEDWEKLLKSAVANAEHNHELLGDDLKIHAVFADEGPTLKRFRPRAMGRATKIRKRTSHLTIQLTPKEQ
jgi:ribosomal protein L22